jgi:hypothetical protein
MGANGESHPIVEQAELALRRLAEAPPAAHAAEGATKEITAAWGKAPLSVGVGGGIPARTELFNFLCGDRWLDPYARAVGSASLRIRRGEATRFRAHHDDGRVEEHVLPVEPRVEAAAASSELDAAKIELAAQEHALARIDRGVLTLARKRPSGLGLLLLPLYWLLAVLYRGRLARREGLAAQVAAARARVDGRLGPAKDAEAAAKAARDRFIAALRVVGSGGAGAVAVREVEIELAHGPLAEGVEILELTGPARASAQVDAVFVCENEALVAPARGAAPLSIGAFADAVKSFTPLVASARALTIGRRSRDKISATIATIDDALARAEDGFQRRIERLEAMRVTDPVAFTEAQLVRLAEPITGSLQAILEHASVHLGSELAQLQHEWVGGAANAADADALKAHATKLTEQWTATPRRIGEEVRLLVMGGVGGSARDLYADLVTPLRDMGLPEAHHKLRAAPVLPPVAMLPSLFSETAKLELPGFFGRLFQSFETRRAELREKTHARAERLQELASAELLDAEPLLRGAMREVLARELATAIGYQRAWLGAALAAEQAAIVADRQLLAPLVAIRDAVRTEARRLDELIAQHEEQHPAIAISSSAAATASLSH